MYASTEKGCFIIAARETTQPQDKFLWPRQSSFVAFKIIQPSQVNATDARLDGSSAGCLDAYLNGVSSTRLLKYPEITVILSGVFLFLMLDHRVGLLL